MIHTYSMFCNDIDRQSAFYRDMFGWAELTELTSPIFRGLSDGRLIVGFHAPQARALLGIDPEAPMGLGGFVAVEVETSDKVDRAVNRCHELGGTVVKPAFATYYGQWQTVLRDPEGNLLRVACLDLPEGVVAPVLGIKE